jgi:hypothetical protein
MNKENKKPPFKGAIYRDIRIWLDTETNVDAGYLIKVTIANESLLDKGFITISFRNAALVTVEDNEYHHEVAVEEMPISAAIALRDFLNYALPPNEAAD